MLFLYFVCIHGIAQDNNYASTNINISIPEVALLDLEYDNSSTIILSPNSPTEAGASLDFINAENSSVWINYSSIVGNKTHRNREVTAFVEGNLPKGLKLKLNVSSDAGQGAGKMGIPLNNILLSNQAQPILKNIGSCFTGNGPQNGHLVSYSIDLKENDSYSLLEFDNETMVTVVYTLTETN